MQSRAVQEFREHHAIASGDVRATRQLDLMAVPDGASLLDMHAVLGFGLFARFNPTVTVALLVGALSVAGAIFLILELSEPYRGLMRISDEPLRNAIDQIDQ